MVGEMIPALVLGGASTLWDDLAALEALIGGLWPWTVFAVNDSGWAYDGRIHYWVSLHQAKMPGWMERRRSNGYPMDGIEVWGGSWVTKQDDSRLPWVDHVLPTQSHASSGSHAIDIAIHLGHDRVVAVGIPLDFGPHFDRPGPWDSAHFHRRAIQSAAEEWGERVRFMSGWTADFIVRPTAFWLGKALVCKAS